MRGRTRKVLTRRHRFAGPAVEVGPGRSQDLVPVEEPLAIDLDGVLVATTMRTPGHDFELAVGFCHADGLLDGHPVLSCRYCGAEGPNVYNQVSVGTGGLAPVPTPRLGLTTSACGLCGSATLVDLEARWPKVPDVGPPPLEVLAAVAERVAPEQRLFAETGSVHAAAAFDATGAPLVVREDVGRHNALDKVVGRLLLDGRLPAAGLGVFVSGRASYELVQKAWAAGFAALVAVGGPSSLAVEAAASAGLLLCGFARDGRLNVYG